MIIVNCKIYYFFQIWEKKTGKSFEQKKSFFSLVRFQNFESISYHVVWQTCRSYHFDYFGQRFASGLLLMEEFRGRLRITEL